MKPSDPGWKEWKEKRARARRLVDGLRPMLRIFDDPSRREAHLKPTEVTTMQELMSDAAELLDEKSRFRNMCTNLQLALDDAARLDLDKPVTFDFVYRYASPVIADIVSIYDLPRSPGSWPAAKAGTRSTIVARIDGDDT